MKNIMLDIETMGTKPYSAIVAIGAVCFDMSTGNGEDEFYINISLESCEREGLNIDASTVMFWIRQGKQAQESLLNNQFGLRQGLSLFSDWLPKDDYVIWGNSAAFDCGILSNAFQKLNMKVPWEYWQERDVRTLVSFNPEIKKNTVNDLPHNALADCFFQIKYCSAIWNSLKVV